MEYENIDDVVVVEEPGPEGIPSGTDSETETTSDSSLGDSVTEGEQSSVTEGEQSSVTEGEQSSGIEGEQSSGIEGEQSIDDKLNTIIETLNPVEEETVTEESTDYSQLLYEFMVENYTPQEEIVYTVFDKPLNDYSVSEGILFLILVVFLGKCFINVIKDTLWRW